MNTSKPLSGKRIAVLAADGFEQAELKTPQAALAADGADVTLVSLRRGRIRGMHMLQPGDLVVLHTDGISEARNGAGELFGEDRLYAVVRRLAGRPAAEVVAGIDAAVQAHAAGEPQQDDVTVVALAVT